MASLRRVFGAVDSGVDIEQVMLDGVFVEVP